VCVCGWVGGFVCVCVCVCGLVWMSVWVCVWVSVWVCVWVPPFRKKLLRPSSGYKCVATFSIRSLKLPTSVTSVQVSLTCHFRCLLNQFMTNFLHLYLPFPRGNSLTLKMEAVGSSETLVPVHRTTHRHLCGSYSFQRWFK
jgi:hypothetical protein